MKDALLTLIRELSWPSATILLVCYLLYLY